MRKNVDSPKILMQNVVKMKNNFVKNYCAFCVIMAMNQPMLSSFGIGTDEVFIKKYEKLLEVVLLDGLDLSSIFNAQSSLFMDCFFKFHRVFNLSFENMTNSQDYITNLLLGITYEEYKQTFAKEFKGVSAKTIYSILEKANHITPTYNDFFNICCLYSPGYKTLAQAYTFSEVSDFNLTTKTGRVGYRIY